MALSSHASQTDAQIVAACIEGEARAWEELLSRHGRLIFSIARRISPPDAEDIFQNVCILLLENLHQLRDPERLLGWIASTTRREALRYKNRLHPSHFLDIAGNEDAGDVLVERVPDDAPLPEAQVVALTDRHLIERGIAQMSERCQKLLHDLYLAETPLSYDEVAQSHAMPLGSIGPNRARCLESLRKILIKVGF